METSSNFLTISTADFNMRELKPSMHQVIDWVRECRNSKIKLFGDKQAVAGFFHDHFHAAISDRKYEFLSRELKDLFASPVDLVHYSAIITELKESPGNPQAMEHCERVVMQELIQIFKKYVF